MRRAEISPRRGRAAVSAGGGGFVSAGSAGADELFSSHRTGRRECTQAIGGGAADAGGRGPTRCGRSRGMGWIFRFTCWGRVISRRSWRRCWGCRLRLLRTLLPEYLQVALGLYRRTFQPSDQLAEPYVIVGVNVFAAETDREARRLFTSLQQQFLNLTRGHRARSRRRWTRWMSCGSRTRRRTWRR